MKTDRRKFSAQQKVQILRQHLVEKVPISEVCDQNGIQPTQFYQWQKVSHLEAKLSHKDEVIAEIMADHIRLKKILARPERQLDRT